MRAGAALVGMVVLAGLTSACGGKAAVGVQASVFHLKPGTCVVPPTAITASVADVKVVPCSADHTQEVFADVDDTAAGDNYPGPTALRAFADGSCLQRFAAYTGTAYQDSSLFYTYLLPSVRSWSTGDRTVVCLITTTGAPLTSSVRSDKH